MRPASIAIFLAGVMVGVVLQALLSSSDSEPHPVPPAQPERQLPDRSERSVAIVPDRAPTESELPSDASDLNPPVAPSETAPGAISETTAAESEGMSEEPLTLDEAKALLHRSFGRGDSVTLFQNQFQLALGNLKPSLTPAQREEVIDFLERRVSEYLLPELASIRYRNRLDPESFHQAVREQHSYLRKARLHISNFILNPKQASSLPKYWRE